MTVKTVLTDFHSYHNNSVNLTDTGWFNVST